MYQYIKENKKHGKPEDEHETEVKKGKIAAK